jgi:predicted phage-related endonuclease
MARRGRGVRIERRTIVDEQEWLEWREQDITASVVAALFGVHPYETVYGIASRLAGLKLSEPRSSPVMSRGREFQEVVGRYLQRNHETWKIRAANVYLRDPALRLGATPDFFCTDPELGLRVNGVIEAKTVASLAFRQNWADGVPQWIILQTLVCAMLAKAKFAIIAAMVVDPYRWPPELHEFYVPRHEEAEKRIRETVAKFWAALERKEMPAPDFARDGGLIAAMFPHTTPGKTVDLTGDNRMPDLLAERAKVKAQIADLEKFEKTLTNEIKEKIGDAEVAIVNGWRVTLKEINVKEKITPPYTYRLLRAIADKTESEAAE